ncbi:4Fe-4S double cluster binding domain-containing protein [Tepidibacter mesophilus]|uniref:4Fe-4S double cluster binding domain-containing protein n=1 Tax=Tepidibacter mesophilus TaxID=655607 RepID=UPI000C0720EE|nr:reductive dehalogenase domain-containing protein [Tepidibacter mesophilus]
MKAKAKIRNTMLKVIAKPNMNRVLKLEQDLYNNKNSYKSTTVSPERFEILYEILKLKDDNVKLPGFPRTIPIIGSSISDIKNTLNLLSENNGHTSKKVNKSFIKELEEYAKTLGVGSIGYTKVPRKYIFKDFAIMYDNAIVFTMEMNKDILENAPDYSTGVMVHKTYNKLGKISMKIAEFLRKNGCDAHVGHPLMGQTLYPALGELAGLGFHGNHGMLITPKFGPRVRIAAVYTNIENLPINLSDKHKWIEEFCGKCKICVKKCPGEAIYQNSIKNEYGIIKSVDSHKCFKIFSEKHGCTVCMKVCPFNQVGYEKLYNAHKTKINNSKD